MRLPLPLPDEELELLLELDDEEDESSSSSLANAANTNSASKRMLVVVSIATQTQTLRTKVCGERQRSNAKKGKKKKKKKKKTLKSHRQSQAAAMRGGGLPVWCTRELQLVCAAATVVVVLCYALPLPSMLRSAMAWLGAQPPLIGGVLFAALYTVVVVAALPAMLLSLAAGYVWGFARAMLWSSLGASAGSLIAFALGQRALRRTVARVAERYPLFAQVDQAIAHGGWRLVVLLRLSPLTPYNVMNYAMALTTVSICLCLFCVVCFIILLFYIILLLFLNCFCLYCLLSLVVFVFK